MTKVWALQHRLDSMTWKKTPWSQSPEWGQDHLPKSHLKHYSGTAKVSIVDSHGKHLVLHPEQQDMAQELEQALPGYYRNKARLGLRLRPVQTRKEIVDSTSLGVSGGTTSTVTLVNTVNDYTGTVADVKTGSVIKGLYLFVQLVNESSSVNVDWYIAKIPANMSGFPVPGATGGDAQRRWILHEEKGIPGSTTQGQGPLTFRGFIRIPPKLRRMGEDDKIQLLLRSSQIHDFCIKAIYKVFVQVRLYVNHPLEVP